MQLDSISTCFVLLSLKKKKKKPQPAYTSNLIDRPNNSQAKTAQA